MTNPTGHNSVKLTMPECMGLYTSVTAMKNTSFHIQYICRIHLTFHNSHLKSHFLSAWVYRSVTVLPGLNVEENSGLSRWINLTDGGIIMGLTCI